MNKPPANPILDFVSSMKLTIACLVAAIILVFAGTLAQVNFGIHEVQQRYFQSLFVWWPSNSDGFKIPVFPGGHLLGAILLINLLSAHIRRFRWTWSKLGIQLTHIGLIVMLAGGLFTDLFSRESYLRLTSGETKNYSEASRGMELAVIDQSDRELDQVTAIPEARLHTGGVIDHISLPFLIEVRHYYPNCDIKMLDAKSNLPAAASQGIGSRVAVIGLPLATAQNSRDVPSAVVEIVPRTGGAPLGTWLVSDALGAPQTFTFAGKQWRLVMRPERFYKPYSMTLQKFTHERYAGTEIAKNFASRVALADPERGENRDVLIYMNHPLRYRGETYYQAGFEKNDTATVLQVVHNPTFVAPYIACIIVAAGLLIQFAYHFAGFSRRRKTAHTS
ncbi:MAG: cytochrome c biogenesis protein ResB [Verrucomicrobiota bacterium]